MSAATAAFLGSGRRLRATVAPPTIVNQACQWWRNLLQLRTLGPATVASATGHGLPPAVQKKIVSCALRRLPGTPAIGVDFAESCQLDVPKSEAANPFKRGADRTKFSEFYAELDAKEAVATTTEAICVGPIKYTGQAELQCDIDNFKAALKNAKVEEGFLPVAAPASVIPDRKNEYYKSDEELQAAIAQAMRTEYKMIVDAGFVVQLDDARSAVTYDRMVPPGSFADYRRWLSQQVDILNHAIEGLPADRIRYHVCWGSWPGPHTSDVPLKDIVDLILKVKVGAYVIEGANPRHEHEWQVWRDAKLGPGQVLIPGVISHATNVVEHPELVAERIVRLAKVLGRENVIAGTDCGFAQGPFYRRVHPSVMWAKLEALSEGARLASKELWS